MEEERRPTAYSCLRMQPSSFIPFSPCYCVTTLHSGFNSNGIVNIVQFNPVQYCIRLVEKFCQNAIS